MGLGHQTPQHVSGRIQDKQGPFAGQGASVAPAITDAEARTAEAIGQGTEGLAADRKPVGPPPNVGHQTPQGIDQQGIDRDFPLLYEMAQQFDFTERLGGSNAPILEEADRVLRELWVARSEKAAAA